MVWEPKFLVSFWILLYKHLQWGSWHENWPFSSRLWKDQIDQGNRIFGQFCIFLTCNYIATDDRKLEPEVYEMKTDLFSRYFCVLWRLQEPLETLQASRFSLLKRWQKTQTNSNLEENDTKNHVEISWSIKSTLSHICNLKINRVFLDKFLLVKICSFCKKVL